MTATFEDLTVDHKPYELLVPLKQIVCNGVHVLISKDSRDIPMDTITWYYLIEMEEGFGDRLIVPSSGYSTCLLPRDTESSRFKEEALRVVSRWILSRPW